MARSTSDKSRNPAPSRKASSRTRQTANRSAGGQNHSGFRAFVGSLGGKMLIAILITALILLINRWISGDAFDLFFLLTGIELLIGALFLWIIFSRRAEQEEN